jgi:glycosyltransferase involved in cell wall biosynthesis
MAKISAYIIAYNEERNIEAAVKSVLWADEIVVVDSFSSDRTAGIAASLGARVVQVAFEGFGKLRTAAISSTRHEWVFSLDTDERCTEAARDEIRRIVESQDARDAYYVPRRNVFMGRWIRHRPSMKPWCTKDIQSKGGPVIWTATSTSSPIGTFLNC